MQAAIKWDPGARSCIWCQSQQERQLPPFFFLKKPSLNSILLDDFQPISHLLFLGKVTDPVATSPL